MADTQTAEQWSQAASKSRAQLAELTRQFANIDADIADANKTIQEANELVARVETRFKEVLINGSKADIERITRSLDSARSARAGAVAVKDALGNNKSQYETRVVELNAQINDAENQARLAQTAPDSTSVNAPPVSTPDATGVIVTPVPEPTVSNVFITEFDPDPAPYAREIGAGAEPEPIDTSQESVFNPPNDDGSAEGGNTVGMIQPEPIDTTQESVFNPSNDDGAAEGGTTVGNAGGATAASAPSESGAAEGGGDVGNAGAAAAAVADKAAASAAAAAVKRREPLPNPAKDWRVRISLAKSADYLYRAKNAGILSPLKETEGVIFPYMPTIQVGYTAKYDSQLPTHSNYMIHNYQGSSVDGLTITGDFTAQSVPEANYLLAVIHFFKSATKMFYGKDDPNRGVPPPLLYLSGLGQYQFDNHPMVLTNFTYSLPVDVDYIDAYSLDSGATPSTAINGVSLVPFVQPQRNIRPTNIFDGASRLLSGNKKIQAGGTQLLNTFKSLDSVKSITRVPSKISISLTLHPMITRKAVVNSFNLQDYATGKLLRGSERAGGGIW